MTEEPLQHDPRTKSQIKDLIYNQLYAPVQAQFEKRLEAIIYQNTMLNGASHKSFLYKGVVYSCDSAPLPRRHNKLHTQLRGEMDNYIKEIKHLNETEVPYVMNFINQVLNSSNDLCDYLRVFPETLHASIRDLIATCSCRSTKLTEDQVESLKTNNENSISLLKERMVMNLLL